MVGGGDSGPRVLQYEAKGLYSLPVVLPGGEVQLDFARPSGEARLSVWAVPVRTLHQLYGSAAALSLLGLGLVVIKFWPETIRRRPLTAKRIVVYGLCLLVLIFCLGLFGALLSLFIILVSESFAGRKNAVSG